MDFYAILSEAKRETHLFLAQQTGPGQELRNLTEVEKLYDLERLLKEDDLPYEERQLIFYNGGVCFEKLQYLAGVKNYLQPFAKFRVQQFAELKAAMAGKTYKEVIDNLAKTLPERPAHLPPRSALGSISLHPDPICYPPTRQLIYNRQSHLSSSTKWHNTYQPDLAPPQVYYGQPLVSSDPQQRSTTENVSPCKAYKVHYPPYRQTPDSRLSSVFTIDLQSDTPRSALSAKAPAFNYPSGIQLESSHYLQAVPPGSQERVDPIPHTAPGTATPPDLDSDTPTLTEMDDSPMTARVLPPQRVASLSVISKASARIPGGPRVQLPRCVPNPNTKLTDPVWLAAAPGRFAERVAIGRALCKVPPNFPTQPIIPAPKDCIPGIIDHYMESQAKTALNNLDSRGTRAQIRYHSKSIMRSDVPHPTSAILDRDGLSLLPGSRYTDKSSGINLSEDTKVWLRTDDRPGTALVHQFQANFAHQLTEAVQKQEGLTAANDPNNPSRVRYTDVEIANEMLPRLAGLFSDLIIEQDGHAQGQNVSPPPGIENTLLGGIRAEILLAEERRRMVFNRYSHAELGEEEKDIPRETRFEAEAQCG